MIGVLLKGSLLRILAGFWGLREFGHLVRVLGSRGSGFRV